MAAVLVGDEAHLGQVPAVGGVPTVVSHYEEMLGRHPDVRHTFLLMHKAPWKNGDMRSWNLIEQYLGDRPYTVFHGHRHAYLREERNGRDYIRLATTGGVFQPENGLAVDQLVWVTVDQDGAHIANLQMSGILDKSGRLPLGGDNVTNDIAVGLRTSISEAWTSWA